MVCAILCALGMAVGPIAAQSKPNAGPYLLIDAATGEVLAQDRAGETWYPASLTKLVTAYIIFQRLREGKMQLSQEIPITPLAAAQQPSKIGIPAGRSVTVDFALQAMLVYSANDMAHVLAEAASGSIEAFARDMNEVAVTLGLSASHFVNPNGLFDPRQVTSARDIGIIAAIIHNEFPEHARFFSQDYLKVGKRKLSNRNSLIRIMPDADGMKTGFVCNSGHNLVASATRHGRKLIAVVLGAASSGARTQIAKDLLEAGFLQPKSPAAQKVAEIVNLPQGAIVPADMTTKVCKAKKSVQLANSDGLSGWAISFGTYDSMVKADMALRGRLLSPIGIQTRSSVGVVPMPAKSGFAALMWDLAQDQSLQLCSSYRADGAHCEVIPPSILAAIAADMRAKAPPPPPVAQGSEGSQPHQKSRKNKRVRLKLKQKP